MSERYVVAIVSLSTSVEDEARALAADLGTIAYEERQKLAPGLPAIVLSTTELELAEVFTAKLRGRKHRAHWCSSSDVVPASEMTRLRNFAFEPDALVAGDERLPWSDISVLIRATHRFHTEGTTTVKTTKLDLGRAVLTGGLMITKTKKQEVVTRSDNSEPVLYIFRASGEPAWILHEQRTNFAALGADLTPTAPRNFVLAIDRIRARATNARFDERLAARKTTPDELDLLAHILAVS